MQENSKFSVFLKNRWSHEHVQYLDFPLFNCSYAPVNGTTQTIVENALVLLSVSNKQYLHYYHLKRTRADLREHDVFTSFMRSGITASLYVDVIFDSLLTVKNQNSKNVEALHSFCSGFVGASKL